MSTDLKIEFETKLAEQAFDYMISKINSMSYFGSDLSNKIEAELIFKAVKIACDIELKIYEIQMNK